VDSPTIRKTFLDFFAERGHTVVPSSALVPEDPTLLFTSAGMVQFKSYFTGEKEPPYTRATSLQKCFRATDLEEVGRDARHLSFFEMLGNFSFGDYFKAEAIRWAWELVTGRFGLDQERLWATVFESDDDAARFWAEETGIPDKRILRVPTDFWDMGVAGPCGPCSHLYYDRGESYGETFTGVGEFDEDRYFEIWNLVFIKNLRDEAGDVVGDLPKQNVDTGMGLERIAVVLQQTPTIFDIDTMTPILRLAEEITGLTYGAEESADVSLRVLAEHARGMTFLLADGVMPSNEHRGYVLRRLIRRGVRYARKIDVDEPLIRRLSDRVIDVYGDDYPGLKRNADLIRRVVEREEARFDATLRQGMGMLEEQVTAAKGTGRLSGEIAFRLHDTYGFPLDLTREVAEEEGLSLDEAEFEELMRQQRERARAARTAPGEEAASIPALREISESRGATEFLGYENLSEEGRILALVQDDEGAEVLPEGSEGHVICDRTPFYAESGGQVGDVGEIRTPTGLFEVTDTRYGLPGLVLHEGRVTSGEIVAGQEAKMLVDPAHREGVRQSHTATHMLHWALREFLGEHARQQGSLVEPGRLRFDFSHFEAVGSDLIAGMEEEINSRAVRDDSVRAFETTYDYAMELGAIALFGEKYGDHVRVVEIADYSRELCGGTHVPHTGQVGVVKIVTEGSVAAGTRRVEAYTGMAGLRYLTEQERRLREAAEMLRVPPEDVPERLESLQSRLRALEGEVSKQKGSELRKEVEEILESEAVQSIGSSKIVVERRDGASVEELRTLATSLIGGLGSGLVVLGSAQDARANLVVAGSKDLVQAGISAAELVNAGAGQLGGGGGGKPELAVAGGPNASGIEAALRSVETAARTALEGR
jgi:alanyl-tRNA synthetase